MTTHTPWLSNEDYIHIFSKVPRVCVDLIIKNESGILLALRAIDPYQGMWHMPGGMIHKGESFFDAAKRIAKIETGLDVVSIKIVDQFEMLHEKRIDHVQHIISLVCEAEIKEGEGERDLHHDFQSSELKYFTDIPDNTVSSHKEVLERFMNNK